SWSPNVAVSAPFNPFLGYPHQNKIGDYISSVSDNTGADVAYAATFNGEEDIYHVRVAPLQSELANISTRARVLLDDQVAIAGFVITGHAPKKLLIRGIGPSLVSAGLSDALADPKLGVFQGSVNLTSNDNWKVRPDGSSQEAEVAATGKAPTDDLESALVVTLAPGTYTAILSGNSSGVGVGLVEVYDLSPEADSQLTNISTRGFVDTGDNVMIGGIIIGGGNGAGARVIVRAVGPSLADSGVQGSLSDPTLALFDANGLRIGSNDNWKTDDQTGQSQEAEIGAAGKALTDDREAAILTTLAPGAYTAIVRGKNDTTGVALVEVFDLP
ncbi:MAG: hypothetical protein M3Y86_12205, partial [Verrucomicrobiota bacterium]|nr:hypothetical protein [Verrucomicrobiota bacterium]